MYSFYTQESQGNVIDNLNDAIYNPDAVPVAAVRALTTFSFVMISKMIARLGTMFHMLEMPTMVLKKRREIMKITETT